MCHSMYNSVNKTIILIFVFLLSGDISENYARPNYRQEVHQICTYQDLSKSSPGDRTDIMPEVLLNHMRRIDNKPDYAQYIPNHSEKALIALTIAGFPPGIRRILEERLVGIFLFPILSRTVPPFLFWMSSRNFTELSCCIPEF